MTSPALPGVTRRWTTLQAYSDEVSAARVYGGIHYRFSTSSRPRHGSQDRRLTVKTQLLPAKAPVAGR